MLRTVQRQLHRHQATLAKGSSRAGTVLLARHHSTAAPTMITAATRRSRSLTPRSTHGRAAAAAGLRSAVSRRVNGLSTSSFGAAGAVDEDWNSEAHHDHKHSHSPGRRLHLTRPHGHAQVAKAVPPGGQGLPEEAPEMLPQKIGFIGAGERSSGVDRAVADAVGCCCLCCRRLFACPISGRRQAFRKC